MCTFWHSRPTKHIGCSYTKSYFNQFGEIPKSFPQQKSFSPTADICQTNFLSSASFVRLGNFSQGLLLPSSTGAPHGQLQKAPPGILANCNCSHDAMKYLDIFSHQLAQGLSHCFPYVDKKFPLFPMFWQKIYHLPFPLSGEISVEEEDTEIEWEVWENIWKRTGIYILTICNTIRPSVITSTKVFGSC